MSRPLPTPKFLQVQEPAETGANEAWGGGPLQLLGVWIAVSAISAQLRSDGGVLCPKLPSLQTFGAHLEGSHSQVVHRSSRGESTCLNFC